MNKDIEKGLYDGGTTISKKMQAKINKQVHLIPFTDIEDKYVELYDEFNTTFPVNGTIPCFLALSLRD